MVWHYTKTRPNYAKLWNNFKKCTKRDLKHITEQHLERSFWTGSKLNRFLLFYGLSWGDAEYFCTTGGGRGQKREFCCVQSCLFLPQFPICVCINWKAFPFRWGALFMTQPQTCSLKAHTHTHTRSLTHSIFFYQDNQGSPDTNLVSWVSWQAQIQPYLSIPP